MSGDGEGVEHVSDDDLEREDRTSGGALSERDMAILDFERTWWKHAGVKEQAIRERFSISSARYYQVLAALIRRPEALVYDPMLVKRLQRVRDSRHAARQRRTSTET